MRLGWGANKQGLLSVVDDDRSPHKAIAEGLTHFQAIILISRLNRKFKKSKSRKNNGATK
jgi:hypothetical protein